MISRKNLTDDLKRVAAKLGKTPTKNDYQAHGHFSIHQIRTHFNGSFNDALHEAGLQAPIRVSVASEPGFQIAQLKAEVKGLKAENAELSKEALTSKALRNIIEAPESMTLGENSGWMREKREHKSDLTGIPTLFISDVHFDEVVRAEQVGYANEYNHEIAVKRIKNTFTTALDLCKKYLSTPKYDGFICALGGDNLSGNIHEELRETNAQKITKSIIDLTDLYIEGIGTLADEFGKVFVPCVVGNHGRLDRKPRYKFRVQDNFEYLIYNFMAKYFKNDPRVSFLIPDSPDAFWTVYGRTYALTHGDQFSGGSGISGVFSPLMLGKHRKQHKQTALGKSFDIMMCGHFHTYIHTESLIVNGSIKGYDEFADAHNFSYEPPRQALWIDHPEKGITFRMPVSCDPGIKCRSRKPLTWDES